MKLIALLGLLAASSALALEPQETFFYDDIPSDYQVELWSGLPGKRSYLFKTTQPFSGDLDRIGQLKGAEKIRIEVAAFPGEDSWKAWQILAARGVELIGLNAGYPFEPEIDRLNRIGFRSLLFVVNSYPGMLEATRLSKLTADVSLVFARNAFPRYDDLNALKAVDPSISMTFVTDHWPWWGHMDVLRMLPHEKTIRVQNIYPSDQHFEYLHAITHVRHVVVDTDFDPPSGDVWAKFRNLPITWISQDRVPTEKALREFAAWPSAIKVIIDMDQPLSDDEFKRLLNLKLPVEWIHEPPFGK